MAKFQNDNITSQYVLYNSVIPACIDKRWVLFDVNGKRITDTEFEGIGCTENQRTDRTMNNAVIIGKSKVIVVQKDELYGGISIKGDILIPIGCEDIYSITAAGETTYYMKWKENGAIYNAMDMVKAMKAQIGGYEDEEENSESEAEPSPSPSTSPDASMDPVQNVTTTPEENVVATPEENVI